MERHFRLKWALLESGWQPDVRVAVDGEGRIARIETARAAEQAAGAAMVEPVAGFVVPGMANAHSHAFQRGMAGNTEYRLSARDSFWTWRHAMYALANRITPADLELLAAQLFVEMLRSGYTTVAEFHYLHRRADGAAYAEPNELWQAVASAAATAGIGLTFLPTLYQTSDFGAQPLRREQSRFAMATDEFLRAVEARVGAQRRQPVPLLRNGAAFHSLRAVPLETVREVALSLQSIDAQLPVHIHIAEQLKEVEACRASTGRRPIELLLDTGVVDERWCLVHATHATPAELQGIAAARAAVCVSISTEANLGDGFFDAARFLGSNGRLCIGSDSQASVCPAEELRWMEYQARLRKRRRGVLAESSEPHVGTRLWRDAARHGAAALGQPAGVIAAGARADWVVLDPDHASMVGAREATALDHLIFAGGSAAIRDVMVGGHWVVRNRRHGAEERLAEPFKDLMRRLAADGAPTALTASP
ncbi:MAG TPA: formimidoylglutamate deiminase [Steroidobacteraceae bacterium]|nr:formimidoylglutamate deiminase [Steroidobacteraceae bacterium]